MKLLTLALLPFFLYSQKSIAANPYNKSNLFEKARVIDEEYITYSPAELEVWRKRAQTGPYLNEWIRIMKNAAEFVQNPSAERYDPEIVEDCFNPIPVNRTQGDKIRDAAFVYLVDGGEHFLEAVRKELVAQAQVSIPRNCDKWQNQHDPAARLLKQALAYSYVRSFLTGEENAILKEWFLKIGFAYQRMEDQIFEKAFENRYEIARPVNLRVNCPGKSGYYGGPELCGLGNHYNNRASAVVSLYALIGLLFDEEELIVSAKQFVREFIQYNLKPDGFFSDYIRWEDDNEEKGWYYASLLGDAVLSVADWCARAGDFSLYEYAFEGKNLKLLIETHIGCVDGTTIRYATDDPAKADNPLYRINSFKSLGSRSGQYVCYVSWAQFNLYYKDEKIAQLYEFPLPKYPLSGGFNPYGGYWGVYPSKLFMYGRLEGKVWPYPGGSNE